MQAVLEIVRNDAVSASVARKAPVPIPSPSSRPEASERVSGQWHQQAQRHDSLRQGDTNAVDPEKVFSGG